MISLALAVVASLALVAVASLALPAVISLVLASSAFAEIDWEAAVSLEFSEVSSFWALE